MYLLKYKFGVRRMFIVFIYEINMYYYVIILYLVWDQKVQVNYRLLMDKCGEVYLFWFYLQGYIIVVRIFILVLYRI